ncbi:GTP cyclohydrolase II RibA [Salinisphaera sp. SPP-AMP-43]|uniref:GTP cyclohydrolase II RibA n=1 Tax=Salinisphaera sp. SPP-AMP-43 TaxID=3121288 RepID=UPI003C6DCE11
MQHVERAIFDLRRGLPVVINSPAGDHLVAPIEALDASLLTDMRAGAADPARLVLTGHRLSHIGLDSDLALAGLPLAAEDSRADVIGWACDPNASWPRPRAAIETDQVDEAAIALMRRGRLIPAAVVARVEGILAETLDQRVARGDLLSVNAADIFAHERAAPSLLRWISAADVPLEAAPRSRFVVFREADGLREHVAVLIDDEANWPDPVPVRLHSACLTGDLFGSLRCDCGPQLKASLAAIQQRGGGVLLYLAQEGRGIGLANKMRAYQMQDEGLDTVDADRVLGFGQDERDYSIAREMLAQLSVSHIDLLTNNPAKLAAMNHDAIQVAGRSSVYGRLTRENRRYLTTKAQRAGHWLDALLAEPSDRDEQL